MKFGSMKEEFLSDTRQTFLFDLQVAGLDAHTLNAYHHILSLFIEFTGDILVEDLAPDHVRLYIANLSDGPNEGEEHTRIVISHYSVIHEWIRWLYAQKFILERVSSNATPPQVSDLFPVPPSTRNLAYCC